MLLECDGKPLLRSIPLDSTLCAGDTFNFLLKGEKMKRANHEDIIMRTDNKLLIAVSIIVACTNAVVVATPILIASDYYGPMRQVDVQTGSIIRTLSGGYGAGEIDLGPDGLIYASYYSMSELRTIDPVSGLEIEVIPLPGKPRDVMFGPDGQLYIAVCGSGAGQGEIGIYRFNPATKQLSSRFNTSLLNGYPIGLAWGPGDDLFVSLDARSVSNEPHSVVRIDGESGDFEGVFTTENIYFPQSLAFGPDGNLYVGNQNVDTITCYNPDGLYLDTIVTGAGNPQGLYFLPDGDLIWGRGGPDFSRYDFQSGSSTPFSSGYSFAFEMVLVPEPTTLLLLGLGGVMLRRKRTGRAGKT